MALNISFHFNFSYSLDQIPKDEKNIYTQLLYWLMTNKPLKSVISFNSLFIESAIWNDLELIKNVSKLALSEQIEIAHSLYSNLLDLRFLTESLLKKNIFAAIKKFEEVYPARYVKGFYPPYGNYSSKLCQYLSETRKYKYIIVDWYVLYRSMNLKDIWDLPKILMPFKVKDCDLMVLPSVNLGNLRYMFPSVFERYVHTGDIIELFDILKQGVEYSKNTGLDYSCILSIDLNDVRIPRYRINYELYQTLKDATKITDIPINIKRPTELLQQYNEDEILEIDLKSNLSRSVAELLPEGNEKFDDLLCIKIHERYISCVKKLEELERIIDDKDEKSKNLEKLLNFNWLLLLSYYHNVSFPSLGVVYRGVDTKKFLYLINTLYLCDTILEIIKGLKAGTIDKSFRINIEHKPNWIVSYVFNKCIFASFSFHGATLQNLFNLHEGQALIVTPSPTMAIDTKTNEPRFGMFYDVIAQQYYRQFNTFNEYYSARYAKPKDREYWVNFAILPFANMLMEKTYTISCEGGNFIKLDYTFTNIGKPTQPFTVYSISNINLRYIDKIPQRVEDIQVQERDKGNKVQIEFRDKLTDNWLAITIPNNMQKNISTGFKSKILTLRIDVPFLKKDEKYVVPIKIEF